MLKRLLKTKVFDLLIIMSDMRSNSPWILQSLKEISKQYKVKLVFISSEFPSEVYTLAKNRFDFTHVRISNKFHIFSTYLWLLAQLELRQIKVVHAHGFIAGLIGLLLHVFGVGKFFIYTRHHGLQNYVDGRKLVSEIDRRVSLRADKVIVHSQRTYDQILNEERISSKKLTYLPIGINSGEFKGISDEMINVFRNKYGVDKDDFLIGTNARSVPLKGLDFVLEAFTSLKLEYSNLKLLMINISSSSFYLQELKRKYCSRDIIFVENVENVPLFFHSLDVFCHVPISEFAEPAGLVLLEALATGVPCITTNCGLTGEFPTPENWRLVPFKSTSSIIEGLKYLITLNSLSTHSNRNLQKSLLNFPSKFDVSSTTSEQILFYKKLFRTSEGYVN